MRILKLLFSEGWHVLTHSTCLLLEHIDSVFIFHLQLLINQKTQDLKFTTTKVQKHSDLYPDQYQELSI